MAGGRLDPARERPKRPAAPGSRRPVMVDNPGFVDTPMRASLNRSVPFFVERANMRAQNAKSFSPGNWRVADSILKAIGV